MTGIGLGATQAKIVIAPSILTADVADLRSELARIGTADLAHVDVMDNHVVPDLTLGLPVVESIISASPSRSTPPPTDGTSYPNPSRRRAISAAVCVSWELSSGWA